MAANVLASFSFMPYGLNSGTSIDIGRSGLKRQDAKFPAGSSEPACPDRRSGRRGRSKLVRVVVSGGGDRPANITPQAFFRQIGGARRRGKMDWRSRIDNEVDRYFVHAAEDGRDRLQWPEQGRMASFGLFRDSPVKQAIAEEQMQPVPQPVRNVSVFPYLPAQPIVVPPDRGANHVGRCGATGPAAGPIVRTSPVMAPPATPPARGQRLTRNRISARLAKLNSTPVANAGW